MKKLLKSKLGFAYKQEKRKAFSILLLLEALIDYIECLGEYPNAIYLKPKEYVKFCYYTNQYIDAPTLVGIKVFIDHEI